MLLVIDNYDSFTFNLVQFLGDLGATPTVIRNDTESIEGLINLEPERVVVSPGPRTPNDAGVSVDAFKILGSAGIPMLGVCLGHQALGEAFGGKTVRARKIMHGKTGQIRHEGYGIFEGLPSPMEVARYHSLVTDNTMLPTELVPVAWSVESEEEYEIQAMHHRDLPLWGVQFHPESLFSEHGKRMLKNFLYRKKCHKFIQN